MADCSAAPGEIFAICAGDESLGRPPTRFGHLSSLRLAGKRGVVQPVGPRSWPLLQLGGMAEGGGGGSAVYLASRGPPRSAAAHRKHTSAVMTAPGELPAAPPQHQCCRLNSAVLGTAPPRSGVGKRRVMIIINQ